MMATNIPRLIFNLLLLFILICANFLIVFGRKAPDGCFRAAVLDHVQQKDPKNQSDIAKNLELNLKVFEDAAEIAKQKDADIIVFPEGGLLSFLKTRENADRFAEDIPLANLNETLCQPSAEKVFNRLSCLARKHEIFLAANVLDRVACQSESMPKCPEDGKFIFNTAVLFDRKGKLIGKYHKMHLFGEMSLNVPPEPELLSINTELGRLGLQICFDMIFNRPGHQLAMENKIDTMIFPTWWFDEAPLLASSQYQMAWAFGNNISLLASNIHLIDVGSRGSGIYIGPKQEFVASLYNDDVERLVLGNVPIVARSLDKNCPLDPEIVQVPQQVESDTSKKLKYKYANMKLDNTTLIPLPRKGKGKKCEKKDQEQQSEPRETQPQETQDKQQEAQNKTQAQDKQKSTTTTTISGCHEGVCCTLEYAYHGPQDDDEENSCKWIDYIPFLNKINNYFERERYYLLISNRTRPDSFGWTEEFCSLVHCPKELSSFIQNKQECSRFQNSKDLETQFKYVKLTGVFSPTATIYPSAIGAKYQLIHPENMWRFYREYNGTTTTSGDKQLFVIEFGSPPPPSHDNTTITKGYQLSTLALYGRVYDRDPIYEQKEVNLRI